MIKNYTTSNLLSDSKEIKHYFGKKNFLFPDSEKIYFLNQLHSNKVIFISSESDLNRQEGGDAIISSKRNFFIGIKTADCVPILLSDRNSSFVAAIHAGWRGTFYKVLDKTIKKIVKEFNCNPKDIIAAIGPSIGMCCYEINLSLWEKFNQRFTLAPDDFNQIGKKYYLNLQSINKNLLNNNGIESIDLILNCTKCDESFYSYRRDGSTEQSQISIIKLN